MYKHIKLLAVLSIPFLAIDGISQVVVAENLGTPEPVKVQDLQFSNQISSKATDLNPNGNPQAPLAQAPESTEPRGEIPANPNITDPEPGFGSSVTIIPQIGTLGAGLSVATPINGNLMTRFGLNYTGFGLNVNSSDINYKGNLNLFSVSALVDYYPFGINSIFALTGGLTYQNNRVNGKATGRVNVNGTPYVLGPNDAINGDFTFPNNFAPYLGLTLGSSSGNKGGFGFFANLGVLFTGTPQANLSISPTSALNNNTDFQRDFAAEQRKAQNEINKNVPGVYPVLSIGLTYQF